MSELPHPRSEPTPSDASAGATDKTLIVDRSTTDTVVRPHTTTVYRLPAEHLDDPLASESTRPGASADTELTHITVEGTRAPGVTGSGTHRGQIWGDFAFERLLGRGGMGAVYLGRQLSLDRPMAIKVLPRHLSEHSGFKARFQLEAKAVALISSPYVIQVHTAGEHRGNHYFAMEFVEGEDLAQRLRGGWRPSQQEAVDLVLQAARGLVAAAEHGLVHRDIKPGNLMIDRRGALKIMDFGLVKLAAESHALTATGTVQGTVSYFSPEQGRGLPCDQRTDLYALGVVFYELLTGRLPFTGGDATSVIYQHIHVAPRPPREFDATIPDPWQTVVLRLMAKAVEDRYQTAAELAADLERMKSGLDPLSASSRPAVKRRSVALLGAGVTALVALGGGLLWWSLAARPAAAPAQVATVAPVKPQEPAAESVSAPAVAPRPQTAVAFTPVPTAKPIPPRPSPTEAAPAPAPSVPPVPVVAAARPAAGTRNVPHGPALVAAPVPQRAGAGATVTVRLPFDPTASHVIYRWSVAAPVGSGGRFAASDTGLPEVEWTAPAIPGVLTMRVVARDLRGLETTASLTVTVDPLDQPRSRQLKPWIALGEDAEPPLLRLQRDSTGSWWGLAADRLLRLGAGWGSAQPATLAERLRQPAAFWATREGVIILDAGNATVRTFRADGSQVRSFGQLNRPTDLVLAPDGVLYIADQGRGGVLTVGADGKAIGQLGRAGDGDDAFRNLTRIALAQDGTVSCLDAEQRQVLRFDRFQRLGTLALPSEKAAAPIDICHPVGSRDLLLLVADGRVLALDGQGKCEVVVQPQALTGLVAKRGEPLALASDPAGGLLITWSSGFVSRHRPDGTVAVRGAALRRLLRFAADGQGRIVAADPDEQGFLLFDAEGWLIRRFGAGKVADVRTLAVVPDGSAVHVLDRKRRQVVRFRLDGGNAADSPLIFGQEGTNPGQFESVTDLAVDAAGRSYVLDEDLYRISVFDANGRYLACFGSRGRGAHELRSPTLLAVAPDGSAVYVYDDKSHELKKWAFDPLAGKATYVGIGGGSGDGPMQFRAPFRLGCDRLGLLYVLDSSRRDVQVLDFHGANLVPVHARKAAEVGLSRCTAGAVSPDGQVWLAHDGRMVGLGW